MNNIAGMQIYHLKRHILPQQREDYSMDGPGVQTQGAPWDWDGADNEKGDGAKGAGGE